MFLLEKSAKMIAATAPKDLDLSTKPCGVKDL